MAILFEPSGKVLLLTINRPEAMNAVDPETDAELADAWQRFDADPALQAAVVTGAGDKAFSAVAQEADPALSRAGAAR
jgi:enoyl-CoA hydratase/carnithine racemase